MKKFLLTFIILFTICNLAISQSEKDLKRPFVPVEFFLLHDQFKEASPLFLELLEADRYQVEARSPIEKLNTMNTKAALKHTFVAENGNTLYSSLQKNFNIGEFHISKSTKKVDKWEKTQNRVYPLDNLSNAYYSKFKVT